MADRLAILATLSRESPNAAAGSEWENEATGTRGTIETVKMLEEEARTCLSFTTTRASFDGVALYRGLACENDSGELQLRRPVML